MNNITKKLNQLIKIAQIKSLVDQANSLTQTDSSELGEGDKFQEAILNLIHIPGIDD